MIPLSLHAKGTVFPWLTNTSIYRSFPTICSGVDVFFGIFQVPFCTQSLVSTGTKMPGHIWTQPGLQDLADDILGKDCEHISGLEVEGRHPRALPLSAFTSKSSRQWRLEHSQSVTTAWNVRV